MLTFTPPDAAQAAWLVQHKAERSYLRFIGLVHETLCLYSMRHGQPYSVRSKETRDDFEERLLLDVKSFELRTTSFGSAFESLARDIESNKKAVAALHAAACARNQLGGDVDLFLTAALEAYEFVVRIAKGTTRNP